MRVEKAENKWIVVGEGEGWVFNRTFPRKWKAEIALDVFKVGGRVSDYWEDCRDFAPIVPHPFEAIMRVEVCLEVIKKLKPTCAEIEYYAEKLADEDEVTDTRGKNYFGPYFHNTYQKKIGGRVHIDIGCSGYHLMLDKHRAKKFIKFIVSSRKA